ncbi:MAG TPA: hypothetical protein EYQ74_04255 [Planctomycetes bacterium]|nr:hypothetical protein [Planctomycetota bacterium]HIK60938.1 hypothetical protein [Planctomycetota bacterium]
MNSKSDNEMPNLPEGTTQEMPPRSNPKTPSPSSGPPMLLPAVLTIAGLWAGCALLYQLLSERPQFVGMGSQPGESWLVQDCPSFVARKVGDPSYAYTQHSPRTCDVQFDLKTNEDTRGLKVIRSLGGVCDSSFVIENPYAEPSHILLQVPRPTELRGGPIDVSSFALEAPEGLEGEIRELPHATLWSGQLAAGQRVKMNVGYKIPAVTSVSVAVDPQTPKGMEKVSVAVQLDQDVPLVLQGGSDTGKRVSVKSKSWSRENMLSSARFGIRLQEGHSVYGALQRLLEIAPLVGGMFVVTLLALLKRGRQAQPSELILLTGVYAYYFPLLLYLNANYAFHWAFIIAFVASSAILLNYARFLLGFKKGVLGGLCLLGLFQVVPTLMAFARWDRGMCLLSLSAITLFVIVDLQTQKLKKRLTSGALAACAIFPPLTPLQDIRVSLPAELLVVETPAEPATPEPEEGMFIRGVVRYEAKVRAGIVEVQAHMPVEVTAARSTPELLLPAATYLRSITLPEQLQMKVAPSGISVSASGKCQGEIWCTYGAVSKTSAKSTTCKIPLFDSSVGWVQFESPIPNVRFTNAIIWSKKIVGGKTVYELAVSGKNSFEATWNLKPELGSEAVIEMPVVPTEGTGVYGLDVADSRHLTIIEADGEVLHFSQFTITRDSTLKELAMTIPAGSTVTSVSVDGVESASPSIADEICTVPLGDAPKPGRDRLVELRIRSNPVSLAFMGQCKLNLPRAKGTERHIEWAIATPEDFEVSVLSGGFRPAREWKSRTRFGTYGSVLEDKRLVSVDAVLVPFRPMHLELSYKQAIPGFTH